uniref:Uncharacterized protein n=1 Tax=Rhizophora mucronata TaxID=61149 RepID=A0A2P2KDB4_RHIMU
MLWFTMLPCRDARTREPRPSTCLATQERPCSGPYNFILPFSAVDSWPSASSSAGPIIYSSMDVSAPIPRPSTSKAISPETSSLPRNFCRTCFASRIFPLLTSHRGDSGK